jgi:hypothetical protein
MRFGSLVALLLTCVATSASAASPAFGVVECFPFADWHADDVNRAPQTLPNRLPAPPQAEQLPPAAQLPPLPPQLPALPPAEQPQPAQANQPQAKSQAGQPQARSHDSVTVRFEGGKSTFVIYETVKVKGRLGSFEAKDRAVASCAGSCRVALTVGNSYHVGGDDVSTSEPFVADPNTTTFKVATGSSITRAIGWTLAVPGLLALSAGGGLIESASERNDQDARALAMPALILLVGGGLALLAGGVALAGAPQTTVEGVQTDSAERAKGGIRFTGSGFQF